MMEIPFKIRNEKITTFFEYEMDFSLYKYLFRIKKYGRLKEIPIKEEIDKKIYNTINNQLFMTTNNIANQIEQLTLSLLGNLSRQTF